MEEMIKSRGDWLRWRKKGIGGSDMPIVLGSSPWKTPLQLYEEKLSDQVNEESNFQTDLGNEAEPKIRALFELIKGKSFKPALCVMEEFRFLLSSLDGISEDKKEILEIKLSGKDDWDKAKSGSVPDKYYPQCQHNMMVSGAKKCFFISYSFGEYKENRSKALSVDHLAIVEVTADQEYQGMLIREGTKFWDHVMKQKPPVASDQDFKPLVGLAKEAKRWAMLTEKKKEIEAEIEEIRSKIEAAAERQQHPRFLCAGIKLYQVSKQGNVDYGKIPAIKAMKPEELDKYRKSGSVYWKFDPPKPEVDEKKGT